MIRKSLRDLNPNHVREAKDFPGLPDELKDCCYWLSDAGYCIMAVPAVLLREHFCDDLFDYECPVPVKYVLEKGWRMFEGFVVVDIPYNSEYGLMFDEKYDTWTME